MPRFLHTALRKLGRRDPRGGFVGPFSTWEEAARASTGMRTKAMFEANLAAMRQVRDGVVPYARDSVTFATVQHAWPLLAMLLWVASRQGGRLRVLDFGGSLGTTYYQNREFLRHLPEWRWGIVEQEPYVTWGRDEFANAQLVFYADLEQCWAKEAPQVVLLSSVLQYLERPHELLRTIKAHRPEYILLDRTAFLESASGDTLMVQHVPASIFPASYPAWFFVAAGIVRDLAPEYRVAASFESLDRADVPGAEFKGILFERAAPEAPPGPRSAGSHASPGARGLS